MVASLLGVLLITIPLLLTCGIVGKILWGHESKK